MLRQKRLSGKYPTYHIKPCFFRKQRDYVMRRVEHGAMSKRLLWVFPERSDSPWRCAVLVHTPNSVF